MHTLIAVTFPEMGRGLLAVVIFGAALLTGLAGLTMVYSAAQMWRAHVVRRGTMRKERSSNTARGAAITARLPAR